MSANFKSKKLNNKSKERKSILIELKNNENITFISVKNKVDDHIKEVEEISFAAVKLNASLEIIDSLKLNNEVKGDNGVNTFLNFIDSDTQYIISWNGKDMIRLKDIIKDNESHMKKILVLKEKYMTFRKFFKSKKGNKNKYADLSSVLQMMGLEKEGDIKDAYFFCLNQINLYKKLVELKNIKILFNDYVNFIKVKNRIENYYNS